MASRVPPATSPPSMNGTLLRGPPHVLAITLPTSMPTPITDKAVPRTTSEVKDENHLGGEREEHREVEHVGEAEQEVQNRKDDQQQQQAGPGSEVTQAFGGSLPQRAGTAGVCRLGTRDANHGQGPNRDQERREVNDQHPAETCLSALLRREE